MFKQYPFLRALFIFLRNWIIAIIALLILYFAWLREWQMTWGATTEEVSRYMAGDELLKDPDLNATRAVEIEAPPEQVWPWLVQMGWKKAGLYSFGKLDNGGMPSARRIIPEYQNLFTPFKSSIKKASQQHPVYYLPAFPCPLPTANRPLALACLLPTAHCLLALHCQLALTVIFLHEYS